MTSEQGELYAALSSELVRQTSGSLDAVNRNVLRALGRSVTRLLQLASNPLLLAKSMSDYPELMADLLKETDSPKIQYACLRARHLARLGRKVIIWSTFVSNVELISLRLTDIGADYIHGGVEAGSEDEAETRERKIARFHDDGRAMVLVANPAACGEGISLHAVCHDAIYVDRNYNVAQYLQSEDRIHRLGLPPETKTNVEILTAPGTVDESVHRRLVQKVQRMASVLEDASLSIEPERSDWDDEDVDEDDLRDILAQIRGA